MPLTTREKVVENTIRFQFVLGRQRKDSSESNNHHQELPDSCREQPAWLRSLKQLGNKGKQEPLCLTLLRGG